MSLSKSMSEVGTEVLEEVDKSGESEIDVEELEIEEVGVKEGELGEVEVDCTLSIF